MIIAEIRATQRNRIFLLIYGFNVLIAYRLSQRRQNYMKVDKGTRGNAYRCGTILLLLMIVLVAGVSHAYASVALLMEEPYGEFGAYNPTGHAAVYLNHVCADSPISLRPCHDGEYGVVVSRYHKIDGYDWVAMPLIPYLYAVDSLNDVPTSVDKKQVAELRDEYRRKHLLGLAPSSSDGQTPKGEWTQLIGASYDRKIHGFEVDSTPEQDQRFIALFNDRSNVGHFNLLFHNCADFSQEVLDTYFPHAIHRNFIADVGLMTPKQVARSLGRLVDGCER